MGKLNPKFQIEREALEDRLSISFHADLAGYDQIVPLRDIQHIDHMAFVKIDVLEALIRSIPLRTDGEPVFPYANAIIQIYGVEPKGIAVGQTFVQSSKILDIMKNLTAAFRGFVTKGVSKMPPVQVYGTTDNGHDVMAFYIPPLVEHQGSNGGALIDGMHRSYICSSAGTTINAVHVRGVEASLPFSPISWDEVSVVDEKPPIDQRYVSLKKSLFRDLSYVGIDG